MSYSIKKWHRNRVLEVMWNQLTNLTWKNRRNKICGKMHRNLRNLIAKKTESISTIINPLFMVGDSIWFQVPKTQNCSFLWVLTHAAIPNTQFHRICQVVINKCLWNSIIPKNVIYINEILVVSMSGDVRWWPALRNT